MQTEEVESLVESDDKVSDATDFICTIRILFRLVCVLQIWCWQVKPLPTFTMVSEELFCLFSHRLNSWNWVFSSKNHFRNDQQQRGGLQGGDSWQVWDQVKYFLLKYFLLKYFLLKYFLLKYFLLKYFLLKYFLLKYFLLKFFLKEWYWTVDLGEDSRGDSQAQCWIKI